MKRLLRIFLLLTPSLLQAQVYFPYVHPTPFPDYYEVASQFYRQYHGTYVPEIHIEKRRDGFYVTMVDGDQEPLSDAMQLWTPVGGWQALLIGEVLAPRYPGPELEPQRWEEYAERHTIRHKFESRECNANPFFGYPGYCNDIVAALEPHYKDLNNDQLYSLARAYSFSARDLLSNQSGYADTAQIFRLLPGQNALSDDQLARYLDRAQKAIATYDRLQQRAPDFETIVGTARIKHANEILDTYLTLLYHQNETVARNVLKPGLYDAWLLQTARNMLASCPKDAVLFVYGDNDTYLPMYVQATENFRTDVVVANLSLLNIPRYVHYLYNNVPGAKPLKTTLPPAFFHLLHLVDNETTDPRDTMEAERCFRELFRSDLLYDGPEYLLFAYPMPRVQLPPAPPAAVLPGKAPETAYWFKESNYVYADDLVKLDIAASNTWERPICFSVTCLPEDMACFNGYMAVDGLVFRLFPNKFPEFYSMVDCPVAVEPGTEFWLKTYRGQEVSEPLESGRLPFYFNHFLAGRALVKRLQREGRCREATDVAAVLDRYFTNTMQPRDAEWIDLVEAWAACGNTDKAEKLGLEIWQNYTSEALPNEEPERTPVVAAQLEALGEKYGLKKLKRLR